MMKRAIYLILVLCLLCVLVPVPASAAGTEAGVIQIHDRTYSAGNSLSFRAVLSGAELRGDLFAAVYTEEGKMRASSRYAAAASVEVHLSGVEDTDYVKVFWTGSGNRPIAEPALLRMNRCGAAAYDAYTEKLTRMVAKYDYEDPGLRSRLRDQSEEERDPYALRRLLVETSESMPSLKGYAPVEQIDGPDGLHVLQFSTAGEAKACAEYLSGLTAEAGVLDVAPDQLVLPAEYTYNYVEAEDPPYSWGVEATHADQYAARLAKSGKTDEVIVAVVDTGAQLDHPFLTDRLVEGFDVTYELDRPNDTSEKGHGTHVAGTIKDCTPGLSNIKIMPIRVFGDDDTGTISLISNGILAAAGHGAQVINLSVIGPSACTGIQNAIEYAESMGVVVAACAGNYSSDNVNTCPAHHHTCITVSSADKDRSLAGHSSYGEAVDVCAPGVEIVSSVPGGKYARKNGTSMATPHVTAAAAMLKLGNPSLTPCQVETVIRSCAADLGEPGWDKYFGAGFLDMAGFPIGDWKQPPCLTFVPCGGKLERTERYVSAGDPVGPLPVPLKEGYVFAGWYTAPEGGQLVRTETRFDPAVNGTLYAHWVPRPEGHFYALYDSPEDWNYAKNGFNGHLMTVTGPEEQAVLEALLATGTKNGYWLGGFGGDDNSRTAWITGEPFEYANWAKGQPAGEPDVPTGLLAINGDTPGQWMLLAQQGEDDALSPLTLENLGYIYEFDGLDNKTFTISFSPNGGKGTMESQSCRAGDFTWLNENSFTRNGYQFAGWNTKPKGTGEAYPDASRITPLGDLTLYAQWTLKSNDVCAVLYSDGLLTFQKDSVPRRDVDVVGTYPVGTVSSGNSYEAAWLEHKADITAVSVEDAFAPETTAGWFDGCENLQCAAGLSRLDTSGVTDMSRMFRGCSALRCLYLGGMDTGSAADFTEMFSGCGLLKTICASDRFAVGKGTAGTGMFQSCEALTGGAGTSFEDIHTDAGYARLDGGSKSPGYFTESAAEGAYVLLYDDGEMVFQNGNRAVRADQALRGMYPVDLETTGGDPKLESPPWIRETGDICKAVFADPIAPRSTACWFWNSGISDVNSIENLDTSRTVNMNAMFYSCQLLESLDVSGFKTSHVTDMGSMFGNCRALKKLDLRGLDLTGLKTMDHMFINCENLEDLDLTGLTLTSLEGAGISNLFSGCSSLRSLDLSGFDTSGATYMIAVFSGCSGMKSLDLSSFDTAQVQMMDDMFRHCTFLETIYVSDKFKTDALETGDWMFEDCEKLTGGQGTTFDDTHTGPDYARIDGGPSSPGYFTAKP